MSVTSGFGSFFWRKLNPLFFFGGIRVAVEKEITVRDLDREER